MCSARSGTRWLLGLLAMVHVAAVQAEEPAHSSVPPDRPDAVAGAPRVVAPPASFAPLAPNDLTSAASQAAAPALQPWRGSPFAIRLALDLPLTLGASALALGSELAKSELPGPLCTGGCDPQRINALDRLSIGSHSQAARTASDVLVGVNLGLPFVLDLFDVLGNHPPDGWRGYGKDVLILAEVFAVDVGLNAVVKYAVRRPRPLLYDPDLSAFSAEERTAPDAALSFYSGHSSTSFAMATAYSYLFMRRHPGSPLVVPVWLISEGLAATTAALRVVAGKHFITDVLTGAAIGSVIGLLIPYLHGRARLNEVSAPAGSPRFSIAPMAYSGGGGLLLTIESR